MLAQRTPFWSPFLKQKFYVREAILLFRNLKAQNGIFWARIGCFDVYDNDKYEVHSINLVEHLNFGWLW